MQFQLSVARVLFSQTIRHGNFSRTLATKANGSVPKERKKKAQTGGGAGGGPPPTSHVASARLGRELEEHFGPKNYSKLVDSFPSTLLKRGSQNTERFYIGSPEAAKNVGKYVMAGVRPETALVEVNPGIGLLTKELLKKGQNKLWLFETEEFFEPQLSRLVESSGEGDRVVLRLGDFNGHWRHQYQDGYDHGKRAEKLFEGLPRKRWKDEDVNFRLFSAVGTLRFFKTLISSVASQKGLFGLGRCEMVLAVPPLVFVHLTCTKNAGYKLYRSSSVLFQLFFEHELIGKTPRRDFLPWPTVAGCRKNQARYRRLGLDETSDSDWFLMRVVPRRDLFQYCLPDNLKLLMFFVTQNLISRKNRIIPAVERWIPFSGARLILNQNYVPPAKAEKPEIPVFLPKSTPLRENDFPERITIFTEFGELTPTQILTVFNEFINWPEFQQSPFLQTMEQHYSKHQTSYSRLDPLAEVDAAADAGVDGLEDDDEVLLGGGRGPPGRKPPRM